MPPNETDPSVRLMERLAGGDESALGELYQRWSKPLLNFLYGMCADRALSEDLMQEVFVKVWRAAPRYQPLARFSTWLFQIAKNHWLNEREKKMRRIRPISLDAGVGADPETGKLGDLVDSGARGPEAKALDHELATTIHAAVARLPEKLRSVWTLGAGQGMPYAQISEILDIPVGTVKSRMFQAVRVLREELSPPPEFSQPAE